MNEKTRSRDRGLKYGASVGVLVGLIVGGVLVHEVTQWTATNIRAELPEPERTFRDLNRTCWWYPEVDAGPSRKAGGWVCTDGYLSCDATGVRLPVQTFAQPEEEDGTDE